MESEILIAGGTGELGGRIIKALLKNGAKVKAIVRDGKKKIEGVTLIELDMNDHDALVAACKGVSCVISALAGLREVIVDTQVNCWRLR